MADASDPKTCSICGIDVTGKTRTKDAQGRYVCAECLEKAKQTQQVQQNPPKPKAPVKAAAGAADGDNSFILEIGGKSQGTKGGRACPNCGRVLTDESVICIGCGYNANSGKQMQVKVVRAKNDKNNWRNLWGRLSKR